jgi:hypothetical protein
MSPKLLRVLRKVLLDLLDGVEEELGIPRLQRNCYLRKLTN